MYLNHLQNHGAFNVVRAERGSMLIMALFVLIILSLLAGTMLTIISGSSKSVTHEVYGLRAQQAAQAGIERLISSSFPANANAQSCTSTVASPPAFSNISGLNNCTYRASCSSNDINFNSANARYYRFSSTGSCDTGSGIVSRTMFVDAMQENLP